MKAGERLVIDQLAVEFGTSLIPVREALARLHAERLVAHEANKGYRIAPAPDLAEMKNLFEARIVIELGALRHGFANVTPATIRELKAVNRHMAAGRYGKDFSGFKNFIDLNARFHDILVGLAQNPFINQAYARLGYHQRIAQTLYGSGPTNLSKIIADHDAIVEALQAGQRDAAADALEAHIKYGLEDVFLRARNAGQGSGTTAIAGK